MKKLLETLPKRVDAAFAEAAAAAEGAANKLRWWFVATFAIAALWSSGDDMLTTLYYLTVCLLWLIAASVFGFRQRRARTAAPGNAGLYVDLGIIGAGLVLADWEHLFATKGIIVFLCYFPVLALTSRRYSFAFAAQAGLVASVSYAVIDTIATGRFPLLRLAALFGMTLAAIFLTRAPKAGLTKVAGDAAREAYALGAREKEVELTAIVHAELMPPAQLELPGLYATVKHAPGLTRNGDYYQVFETARGPLVILGDLPGNGLAATVAATQLHQKIAQLVDRETSLPELLTTLNMHLWRKYQGGQTFTCVLARWEGAHLHYVNAGHLPAFHLSKRVTASLPASSSAVGAAEQSNFVEEVHEFAKGDLLVLYTDGAYSGLAETREQGAAEVERLLGEFSGGEVNTLCHRVFDCGQPNFAKPQDDSTVVIVRRQAYAGEAAKEGKSEEVAA